MSAQQYYPAECVAYMSDFMSIGVSDIMTIPWAGKKCEALIFQPICGGFCDVRDDRHVGLHFFSPHKR